MLLIKRADYNSQSAIMQSELYWKKERIEAIK